MQTTTESAQSPRATTDERFDADIASAPLVLVKFTGEWCPPCKALQPTLNALVRDRPELLLLTLDVDDHQRVAQRYGIRGVPTLLAFRNGSLVGQLVGNQPRARIDRLLEG